MQADTDLLKKYAALSGGRYLDLTKLNTAQALQTYGLHPTQVNVQGVSGNLDKNNTYAQLQDGRLTIVSKKSNAAEKYLGWVKVEVVVGARRLARLVRFDNSVEVSQSIDKLWASRKIDELNRDYKKHKQHIINVAKRYKVLTKDMSLIVLDRVEDYVRYEIQPPSELRAEYARLIKGQIDKKKHDKERALIESIKLVREQSTWYRRTFDKTKPKPVLKKVRSESDSSSENVQDLQMPVMVEPQAVMPAPVMRPRPVMMAKRAAAPTRPNIVGQSEPRAKISLKSFNPNTPYLKKIKGLDRSKWMENYHQLKRSYITQPMFYVDVADLFYKNEMKAQALIILSNVLELDFHNSEFLRVYAFKAMEFGQHHLAVRALEQVKKLRPFELQSSRDLALAYEKAKQPQKSLNELYSILTNKWDNRFSGAKIVVINELNRLLAKNKNLDKRLIDKRLLSEIFVDLRVVINWSSDNTDIDLWVIDPYGEKTYYSNKVSRIGGKISNDMTLGYGPEEFLIKDAVSGNYKIQANYYGNTQQKAAIPVTIRGEVYSHYAATTETQKEIVLRLENKKAVIDIGSFEYEK